MEANNVKAMLEAIDEIKNTANSALTALSIGNDTSSFLCDIIRKCEAVACATMRNCDRFDDLKSAQQHYIEHGCQKGLGMIVDGEIRKFPWKSQFEKWLFAQATEQKGESNGSK